MKATNAIVKVSRTEQNKSATMIMNCESILSKGMNWTELNMGACNSQCQILLQGDFQSQYY